MPRASSDSADFVSGAGAGAGSDPVPKASLNESLNASLTSSNVPQPDRLNTNANHRAGHNALMDKTSWMTRSLTEFVFYLEFFARGEFNIFEVGLDTRDRKSTRLNSSHT